MSSLTSSDVTARDGTTIRRWRRSAEDAEEAVFFVHGATYGGRSAFAPAGFSWLDAVADAGRTAYTLDVRGYGDSDRPGALSVPPAENDPVVRAVTAARDAADALAAVHERHDRVHLVGYSWGTIISGVLLTQVGAEVDSLTQYAPVYRPPEDLKARASTDDAYRTVTKAEARERWTDQRPADEGVPEDAFEAFWQALYDSNQRHAEGTIAAPNGTHVDLVEAIEEGPIYDAGAIDLPALVVRGSLDTASVRRDAMGLFDALGTDQREYAEISGGSHFLQFEPRRAVLYDTVRRFQDRVSG